MIKKEKCSHKDSIPLYFCHKLEKIGINGQGLSHTHGMEKQTQQNQELTKANSEPSLTITSKEAEEYCAYKRQKKISEITSAVSRASFALGDNEDAHRACERAVKLRLAAVKMPPSRLLRNGDIFLRSGVPVDCIVGGTGETLPKVKACEARAVRRLRAQELTVVVTPSLIANCRYGEIKKELRRVCRAAGKTTVKVWVNNTFSHTTLTRVARIACEVGAKYFSVPYFVGCERLRMDLTGGCQLEVSGVDDLETFQRLTLAGVGRIVSERISEINAEWLKEAEKITFPAKKATPVKETQEKEPSKQEVKEEKKPVLPTPPISEPLPTVSPRATLLLPPSTPSALQEKKTPNPETDYRCRLEGSELKFL